MGTLTHNNNHNNNFTTTATTMKTALIPLAVSTLTVLASDDLQVFTDYSDFNYEDVQVELSAPVLANDRTSLCQISTQLKCATPCATAACTATCTGTCGFIPGLTFLQRTASVLCSTVAAATCTSG